MTDRVTLPLDVIPVHYALELTPNFEKLDFQCKEIIDVNVTKEAVDEVTLHSKEIYVESASFSSEGDASSYSVTGISYNVKYHTVKFSFDKPLPVGAGKLNLQFRGILNGDMAGFYKSTYADANGNKKIMASTQFEALDARRYFFVFIFPKYVNTDDASNYIIQRLSLLGRARREGNLWRDADHPLPPDRALQHARAVHHSPPRNRRRQWRRRYAQEGRL